MNLESPTTQCPKCGRVVPLDSVFCNFCGAKMPSLDGAAPSVPSAPPMPVAQVTPSDALHAQKLLEKAQNAARRSDWRDAVTICRQSLHLVPSVGGEMLLASLLHHERDTPGTQAALGAARQLAGSDEGQIAAISALESKLGVMAAVPHPLAVAPLETVPMAPLNTVAAPIVVTEVQRTPDSALSAPSVVTISSLPRSSPWPLLLAAGLAFLLVVGAIWLVRRPLPDVESPPIEVAQPPVPDGGAPALGPDGQPLPGNGSGPPNGAPNGPQPGNPGQGFSGPPNGARPGAGGQPLPPRRYPPGAPGAVQPNPGAPSNIGAPPSPVAPALPPTPLPPATPVPPPAPVAPAAPVGDGQPATSGGGGPLSVPFEHSRPPRVESGQTPNTRAPH